MYDQGSYLGIYSPFTLTLGTLVNRMLLSIIRRSNKKFLVSVHFWPHPPNLEGWIQTILKIQEVSQEHKLDAPVKQIISSIKSSEKPIRTRVIKQFVNFINKTDWVIMWWMAVVQLIQVLNEVTIGLNVC